MFHILAKSLHFLISPMWWVLACLLFYIFGKNQSIKKLWGRLSLIFFLVFSNHYLVNEAIKLWEIPITQLPQLGTYNVGLVLGGGVKTEIRDTARVFLNASGDRLIQAVQLYKKGKIKKILYAGGAANLFGQKVPEAQLVYKLLKMLGIPEQNILLEDASVNTYQNAKFSIPILQKAHLDKEPILLITSSLHMRRAQAVFEALHLKVCPYSVDIASESGPHNPDFYVIPTHEAFLKWHMLLHECVGYVVYKLAGYL